MGAIPADKLEHQKVQNILAEHGVDPAKKPDMRSFHFIQIDEFYPINSTQHNSFYYYVNKFYIRGFGLDPKKALLINPNEIGLKPHETLDEIWPNHIVDLSLRFSYPKDALQKDNRKFYALWTSFAPITNRKSVS